MLQVLYIQNINIFSHSLKHSLSTRQIFMLLQITVIYSKALIISAMQTNMLCQQDKYSCFHKLQAYNIYKSINYFSHLANIHCLQENHSCLYKLQACI
jgi:hypothetical protein